MHAYELKKLLNSVVPEAVETSISEHVPLRPTRVDGMPLFFGYREVRTIFFDSRMTTIQRDLINRSNNLRRMSIYHGALTIGHVQWTWLRGLRDYKGMRAVAACYIFNWRSEELKRKHLETEENEEWIGGPYRYAVDIFDDELMLAGVLGYESLHCDFIAGECMR